MSRIAHFRLSPEQAFLVQQILTGAPSGIPCFLTFAPTRHTDEEDGSPVLRPATLAFDCEPKVHHDDRTAPALYPVDGDGGDMGRGQRFRRWMRPERHGSLGFIALEGPIDAVRRLARMSNCVEIDGQAAFPVYGASGGVRNAALCYLIVEKSDLTFEEAA